MRKIIKYFKTKSSNYTRDAEVARIERESINKKYIESIKLFKHLDCRLTIKELLERMQSMSSISIKNRQISVEIITIKMSSKWKIKLRKWAKKYKKEWLCFNLISRRTAKTEYRVS